MPCWSTCNGAAARSAAASVGHRLGRLRPDRGGRRPDRRRHADLRRPRQRPAGCGSTPAPAAGFARGGPGPRGLRRATRPIAGGGDFTGDGRRDLLVRERTNGNGYVLPGTATAPSATGSARSPDSRPGPASARSATWAATAPPTWSSVSAAPSRSGSTRARFELGRPIATGVNFAGGEPDPQRRRLGPRRLRRRRHPAGVTGNLCSGAATGTGTCSRADVLGPGFGSGRPARRGRRHDRRRLPGPDRASRAGAWSRSTRAAGSPGCGRPTWRTARSAAGTPDRRRSLERRRRPRQPVRQGGKLTLYPGNGPGGLTRRRGSPVDLTPYDWVIGVSDVDA